MTKAWPAMVCLMLAEKAWRHRQVERFFRKPVPAAGREVKLVSILQPILSGDPTMPACLERNLAMRTTYPLEYIWLVDEDDTEGVRICRDLMARYTGAALSEEHSSLRGRQEPHGRPRAYPERDVRLHLMPRPGESDNPKMVKLIEGARLALGDVLCGLDDDTQLPDNGLEQCLPYLDEPGVGLAFGLPYYINFSNLWSSLVSYFVDSHSLLTYIPYTVLTEPFTINGMFYAIRRDTLEAIGGFDGLQSTLADDFAVAQRLREHGYSLAQTPLLHGISTHVTGPRHYLSLIQRWFIFPRESLMRHLAWRDRIVLYGFGLVPAILPLVLILSLLAKPSQGKAAGVTLYLAYSYSVFARINRAHLHSAAPWSYSWWVPIIQLLFPLQLIAALLSPRRITWRGHVMQVEKGGGFRFIERRKRYNELFRFPDQ